jgi:hypothetical protein
MLLLYIWRVYVENDRYAEALVEIAQKIRKYKLYLQKVLISIIMYVYIIKGLL